MVGLLDHNWIYANEITYGVPIDSFCSQEGSEWRLAMTERPISHVLEVWYFESCDISLTFEEEGGWRLSLIS